MAQWAENGSMKSGDIDEQVSQDVPEKQALKDIECSQTREDRDKRQSEYVRDNGGV